MPLCSLSAASCSGEPTPVPRLSARCTHDRPLPRTERSLASLTGRPGREFAPRKRSRSSTARSHNAATRVRSEKRRNAGKYACVPDSSTALWPRAPPGPARPDQLDRPRPYAVRLHRNGRGDARPAGPAIRPDADCATRRRPAAATRPDFRPARVLRGAVRSFRGSAGRSSGPETLRAGCREGFARMSNKAVALPYGEETALAPQPAKPTEPFVKVVGLPHPWERLG
jgi:hypothetical protein